MSWFDELVNILQKPQSAATGTYAGLMRMIDSDQDVENRLGAGTNPLSGLVAGLKGNIRPSAAAKALENNYTEGQDSPGGKIAQTVVDLGFDPMLALGGVAKGGLLGAKVAGAASKAGSAGKYAEGGALAKSNLSTAASRALRRTYQGALVGGGDPMLSLGSAALLGLGENTLTKFLPRLSAATIKSAPELADDLSGVPSSMQLAKFGGPQPGQARPARVIDAESRLDPAFNSVPSSGSPIPGQMPSSMGALGPGPMQAAPTPGPMAGLNAGPGAMGELGPGAMPMGQGSTGAIPMGAAPGQGPMQITAQDIINALYKKGNQGKNDQITEAIRAIINSQR